MHYKLATFEGLEEEAEVEEEEGIRAEYLLQNKLSSSLENLENLCSVTWE